VSDLGWSLVWGTIQIGLPVVLIVVAWRRPPTRKWANPFLGGLTPGLLFLAWLCVARVRSPHDAGTVWAFGAAWVMAAPLFIVLGFLGLAAAPLAQTFRPVPGYLVGFGVVSTVLLVLVAMWMLR
jgi:hypothetical protein